MNIYYFFYKFYWSSCRNSVVFCLNTGTMKKLIKITRNKKKKHNKIVMLTKSKLDTIETLISEKL